MTHPTQAPAEPQPSWLRWVLAALVGATLLFGFWGGWRYERDRHLKAPEHTPNAGQQDGGLSENGQRSEAIPDVLSLSYHTCQLLIAHGIHLEGVIPWQLHVGRLLGVLSLFTAGFLAFTQFFRQEMLLLRLRLPWRRNHVVICGLGDLGLRLALDGIRRGKFVVAIEKQGQLTPIERAQKQGPGHRRRGLRFGHAAQGTHRAG